MLVLLLILFVAIPFLELTLLIKLGQTLGPFTAIALVLGTGMLGAALARWQGIRAWLRVQSQLAQGILPASDVMDGLLILAAGLLLLTPGALSDLAGLALLLPPIRALVRSGLVRWFRKRFNASPVLRRGFRDDGSDDVISVPALKVRVDDDK